LVKVSFTYTVQIKLKLDSRGNLTSEIEDSQLHLPFWLFFLSYLIAGLPGLITLSVVKTAVKKDVNTGLGDQVSLNEDLSDLFTASISGLAMNARFDQIETNTTGVFISGDLEIDT
jgi:hypothetical protein